MSRQKERRKARRRAEREMEQAWEALESGQHERAERISRRAYDAGAVNPRICHDHGMILWRCQRYAEAEEALRAAVVQAPNYGEALSDLARFLAERGRVRSACELQQRVVELEGESEAGRQVLATYRALLAGEAESVAERTAPAEERDAPASPPAVEGRARRCDWAAAADQLERSGVAHLPAVLDPEECRRAIAWDSRLELFEHDVEVDDEDRGRVRYRFFRQPLPDLVAELRRALYVPAARIANDWCDRLGRDDRYPPTHEEFLALCHASGQRRTTPILLRYPQGGFNAAHRDVAGSVVFPLQLAVSLGPAGREGGGEFELHDLGRRRRVHRVATEVGDAVLFCTQERLVDIAGTPGLQPVMHAVGRVQAPERFALGIPFHEHAGFSRD